MNLIGFGGTEIEDVKTTINPVDRNQYTQISFNLRLSYNFFKVRHYSIIPFFKLKSKKKYIKMTLISKSRCFSLLHV